MQHLCVVSIEFILVLSFLDFFFFFFFFWGLLVCSPSVLYLSSFFLFLVCVFVLYSMSVYVYSHTICTGSSGSPTTKQF